MHLKKKILSLKSLNGILEMENLELHRKVSWGEDIKQKLEIKYKKIRKQVAKSMTDTSVMDEDTMSINSSIKPAKVCATQSEMSQNDS